MKVYVIKSKQTKEYQTEVMDFIPDIRQADIFIDYEVALAYCRSDCNVVECELIEKNELADHDKKVRAEVVAESQALKARWEKLKEYVKEELEKNKDLACTAWYNADEEFLAKMKEVEKE